MTTGRIDYSPDYKSEKKDYTDGGRLPTIAEMSGSVNFGGRVVFDDDGEQRVVSTDELEHTRLRDAAVEAAKKWAMQMRAEYNTSANEHLNELFEHERPLYDCVTALVEFESKLEPKK